MIPQIGCLVVMKSSLPTQRFFQRSLAILRGEQVNVVIFLYRYFPSSFTTGAKQGSGDRCQEFTECVFLTKMAVRNAMSNIF